MNKIIGSFTIVFLAIALNCSWTQARGVNRILPIEKSADGNIEITLHGDREFPVRNELTVLRIGQKEFLSSRYRPDGKLDTLIFTLTPTEWGSIKMGARVAVYYGRSNENAPDRWEFGTLNKRLMAKEKGQ